MPLLVSGLINIETTLKISRFPLAYQPVRYPFFGVNSAVSGVGYNVAKALTTLGNEVRFLSLVGDDLAGKQVNDALREDGIHTEFVRHTLAHTPQSVILYDEQGRRAIHVDLKDIQEAVYPVESFEQAVQNCSLAVLCNINFSRPLLGRAQAAGIPIATDVHTISQLDDDYNRDFMAVATILFMSDEYLPLPPEDWARALQARYKTDIIVIGLGADGALLAIKSDGFMERIPAQRVRAIVNTIGAGDALFSAFIHSYHQTHDPYTAIEKAVLFAGYKIGEAGAAQGFLDSAALDTLYRSKPHQ